MERRLTTIKNEKYDELIVPNTYYCTFMEGVGQQTALEVKKFNCDGLKVDFK